MQTTKWWMNTLAPLLEPVFRSNHDHVMRSGGEGLARRLRELAAPPVVSASAAAWNRRDDQ